jgi:hypothetical protein
MESRITTKIDSYMATFKRDIHTKIAALGMDNGVEKEKITELLEYIYEYERINITADDFVKRKRVKNSIPNVNRCIAKRSNGEQCTRRRKLDCEFCGTHANGAPHGVVTYSYDTKSDSQYSTQKMEVVATDIQGIVYYIDSNCNVYNTEDIMSGRENPRVIAKSVILDGGRYTIPDFGLV